MGDISRAPVLTGSMLCIHYSNTNMVQQSSSPIYSVHANYIGYDNNVCNSYRLGVKELWQ